MSVKRSIEENYVLPDVLNDKIRGCLYGTAIGDAMGYPVEFTNPWLRDDAPITSFVELVNGVALVSDDTQMLVATLRGLLDAGVWDDIDLTGQAIGKRYAQWAVSPENVRAPGGACMHGARNLASMPWREAGMPDAGGCGTAMRSMAYGCWFPENPDDAGLFAAEHALMTHRHPMAQAAAAAVAAGVAAAFHPNLGVTDIVEHMLAAAGRYHTPTKDMLWEAFGLSQNLDVTSRDVTDKWSGWAGHEAVAASLFCFLRAPNDYRHAVSMAVTSRGDSDSLGAITGALVGAFNGYRSLPLDLVAQVEHSDDLGDLSDEVARRVCAYDRTW